MFQTLGSRSISFYWIKKLVGKINNNITDDCKLVILVNSNLSMTKELSRRNFIPLTSVQQPMPIKEDHSIPVCPKSIFTVTKYVIGKIASSCSHAAVLCYIEADKTAPVLARHWLSVGQKKVVLKWDREESELRNIASAAAKANLISVIVRDAGRTQVRPGSITAVGIGPGSAEDINKVLPSLKLL